MQEKKNLLLGLSGSVASIKIIELIQQGLDEGYNIKVILTKNSKYFIEQFQEEQKNLLNTLIKENNITVYEDDHEWNWKQKGDEVLHIELRKWADLFLIAPLSANTMAKITNGMCDNLLTCVFRAWDFQDIERKKVFVAPAMNTMMFNNYFTEKQIHILEKDLRVKYIKCQSKQLACGDVGIGAMADVKEIFKIIN